MRKGTTILSRFNEVAVILSMMFLASLLTCQDRIHIVLASEGMPLQNQQGNQQDSALFWLQAIQPILTILTLLMTVFLAWYVNYSIKKRLYLQELDEKRLRELYRPMEMTLRASRMAFQRYLRAEHEEQKFIAELWSGYNKYMKDLLIKNSYLFLEPELPQEVDKLLEHIDAYLFDYQQYKEGKRKHPFPGERGYPFPSEVNDYFAIRSRQLVERLSKEKK